MFGEASHCETIFELAIREPMRQARKSLKTSVQFRAGDPLAKRPRLGELGKDPVSQWAPERARGGSQSEPECVRVSHRESQSEPERARVSQREHELYRLQSCIRECFAKKIKMEAIRRCRLRAVSQKMKIMRGKLTPQIIPPCEEVNLVRTLNPLGSVVPLAMFCCRNVNFNYQSTHSVFLTTLLILSTIKYLR